MWCYSKMLTNIARNEKDLKCIIKGRGQDTSTHPHVVNSEIEAKMEAKNGKEKQLSPDNLGM